MTHASIYRAETQEHYEYLVEAVPDYGINHVMDRARADITLRNYTAIPAGKNAPSYWRLRQRARAIAAIQFLRDTKTDEAD